MNLTDAIMNAHETIAAKKAPGRPIVEGSERQKRLSEMEARKQANGGVVRLGRPVLEGSKRQNEINERLAKIANGYVPKKGRPTFASQGGITKAQAEKLAKALAAAPKPQTVTVVVPAEQVVAEQNETVESILSDLVEDEQLITVNVPSPVVEEVVVPTDPVLEEAVAEQTEVVVKQPKKKKRNK